MLRSRIKNSNIQIYQVPLKEYYNWGKIYNLDVVHEKDHEKIVQSIIDWLSDNCIDNFIVLEIKNRIAAGGFFNNKEAKDRGKFKLSNKKGPHFNSSRVENYEIRLSSQDSVAFQLTWIE